MTLQRKTSSRRCALALTTLLFASALLVAQTKTAVTTYHNDNYRTGWNHKETQLTPANVGSPAFHLLESVTLDDQVDTQPLIVPNQNITTGSKTRKRQVVYVATEGNTIYAINSNNGEILLSPNFGPPVRYPLGCNNNGPNVGINGTPVIDRPNNTMYAIIYTNESQGPVYRIHALDLDTLNDKVSPVVVSASHTLANGTTIQFNAKYQRQRPGLLLANGNVYAGFGSFCDYYANLSRGWVLGWQANTLTPLATNQVLDIQASSTNNYFLSSIWMSGYGIAADPAGNLYFVTGNSDYSGTSYDGITNLQESVVKVSGDLSQVLDLFTPSDQGSLDQSDADFGSGGVMLLPQPHQRGLPNLAVAAGKEGNMFLLNRSHMGGFNINGNDVLGTFYIGGCWCGESYFVDPADLAPRVVSSGGNWVGIWKVQTSPSVTLTNISNSIGLVGQLDPGFFTSVSSNGTASPIIWAVNRPNQSSPYTVLLYAFDPEAPGVTLKQIFHGPAGSWPNIGGNSNIVPAVANGKVFVASYQQLAIFGLN
ncbi:MAG: hypothetical protein WB952_17615 [Terriglobales bacterium]